MSSSNTAESIQQSSTEQALPPNRHQPGRRDEAPGNIVSTDRSQLPESFGRMSLENSETSYVESAHWSAILDGVNLLLVLTLIQALFEELTRSL